MTREEKIRVLGNLCATTSCYNCKFREVCRAEKEVTDKWPEHALDRALRAAGLDPETGEKIADQKKVKETTGMTREEKIKMVQDICEHQYCGTTCIIRSVCSQSTLDIEGWTDDTLDECLSLADIDPETGEKITAATDTEETCPIHEAPTCDELIEPEPPVEEPAQDVVNHPQHYELPNGLECIDAMGATLGRETVMAFCKANAFKYLWRHERKNGAEDVEKARWYLNKWHELREDGETA